MCIVVKCWYDYKSGLRRSSWDGRMELLVTKQISLIRRLHFYLPFSFLPCPPPILFKGESDVCCLWDSVLFLFLPKLFLEANYHFLLSGFLGAKQTFPFLFCVIPQSTLFPSCWPSFGKSLVQYYSMLGDVVYIQWFMPHIHCLDLGKFFWPLLYIYIESY